jgi:hypothetical protein
MRAARPSVRIVVQVLNDYAWQLTTGIVGSGRPVCLHYSSITLSTIDSLLLNDISTTADEISEKKLT